MRNCFTEREIDRYLLGRLDDEEVRVFELHFFNCPECYEKVRDREDYVGAVIRKRDDLLAPPAPEAARPPRGAAIVAPAAQAAPPRRHRFVLPAWAMAAAALVVIVGGAIVLRPWGRSGAGDAVVRGGSLAVAGPAGDVAGAPAELAWKAATPGLEYRVELTGPGVEWTASAGPETRIALPDDVRAKLARGAAYTWQVKGYGPEGTLLESSKKAVFRIK